MAGRDQLVAEPLYKRAEQAMVSRIVQRTWPPGHRLPNEFELADEFGVSQGTIRKALLALEGRGLIERAPGRGTIVSRTTPEEALYAFFRLRDPSGALLVPEPLSEELAIRTATAEERQLLPPHDARVIVLTRVRQHAGVPLALEEMRFSAALCRGMENDLPLPNSLYPYLQDRFGIAIMSARERAAAVLADAASAAALGIEEGSPLLEVHRRARDLADRVVELRTSRYVTGDARYEVELTRTRG